MAEWRITFPFNRTANPLSKTKCHVTSVNYFASLMYVYNCNWFYSHENAPFAVSSAACWLLHLDRHPPYSSQKKNIIQCLAEMNIFSDFFWDLKKIWKYFITMYRRNCAHNNFFEQVCFPQIRKVCGNVGTNFSGLFEDQLIGIVYLLSYKKYFEQIHIWLPISNTYILYLFCPQVASLSL